MERQATDIVLLYCILRLLQSHSQCPYTLLISNERVAICNWPTCTWHEEPCVSDLIRSHPSSQLKYITRRGELWKVLFLKRCFIFIFFISQSARLSHAALMALDEGCCGLKISFTTSSGGTADSRGTAAIFTWCCRFMHSFHKPMPNNKKHSSVGIEVIGGRSISLALCLLCLPVDVFAFYWLGSSALFVGFVFVRLVYHSL